MNALLELHAAYSWLPGGAIVPVSCSLSGFAYGLYRYIRSFKYLYYYYIETGMVICWMDDYTSEMKPVAQRHGLNKTYNPFGYISGFMFILLFAAMGLLIGTIWPISVFLGILTIPNFALRYIAKEKRNKVIFEQTLKGTK